MEVFHQSRQSPSPHTTHEQSRGSLDPSLVPPHNTRRFCEMPPRAPVPPSAPRQGLGPAGAEGRRRFRGVFTGALSPGLQRDTSLPGPIAGEARPGGSRADTETAHLPGAGRDGQGPGSEAVLPQPQAAAAASHGSPGAPCGPGPWQGRAAGPESGPGRRPGPPAAPRAAYSPGPVPVPAAPGAVLTSPRPPRARWPGRTANGAARHRQPRRPRPAAGGDTEGPGAGGRSRGRAPNPPRRATSAAGLARREWGSGRRGRAAAGPWCFRTGGAERPLQRAGGAQPTRVEESGWCCHDSEENAFNAALDVSISGRVIHDRMQEAYRRGTEVTAKAAGLVLRELEKLNPNSPEFYISRSRDFVPRSDSAQTAPMGRKRWLST